MCASDNHSNTLTIHTSFRLIKQYIAGTVSLFLSLSPLFFYISMQPPHDFASSNKLLTEMHTNLSTHILAAFMLGRGAH